MPQFDLLIIYNQSSLLLSLIILINLLYVHLYILPLNQTGKYRLKIVIKKNSDNVLMNHIYNKFLNKIRYQYEFHIKLNKNDQKITAGV
jgi:hypothetical protein